MPDNQLELELPSSQIPEKEGNQNETSDPKESDPHHFLEESVHNLMFSFPKNGSSNKGEVLVHF
jgi:hypothetical protein